MAPRTKKKPARNGRANKPINRVAAAKKAIAADQNKRRKDAAAALRDVEKKYGVVFTPIVVVSGGRLVEQGIAPVVVE